MNCVFVSLSSPSPPQNKKIIIFVEVGRVRGLTPGLLTVLSCEVVCYNQVPWLYNMEG